MVHVQLRPIFIGGPSVQLGQLHLIEKLNLYEALRMKRSSRKINTFKCNSTPISRCSCCLRSVAVTSLLGLWWQIVSIPFQQLAILTFLCFTCFYSGTHCYYSCTKMDARGEVLLQLHTFKWGCSQSTCWIYCLFDVAAIIKLYSFHMAQMYPGVILLSLYGIYLAKSSCLRSIKACKSFLWLICALQPTIFMLLQS